MAESAETHRPSIEDEVRKAKESVGDIYTQLELASFGEVSDLVDDALYQEVQRIKDDLDNLALTIAHMPFDNPAQKDAFVDQIGQLFTVFAHDTQQQIDDDIDETERALLEELIRGIDEVIQVGDVLHSIGGAAKEALQKESQEFILTREDEMLPLGDILKGADSARVHANIFYYQSMHRQRAVLERLYGDVAVKGLFGDGLILGKGVDGNMYLAKAETGELMDYLPPFPALQGVEVVADAYTIPTQANELVFECKSGSREESRQRIDTLIDDPFVKKAEIRYTERSIDKYKAKYPGFPYAAGQSIQLVCGDDRKFYFDNGEGKPNHDLPRAFIFAGDVLNYEAQIDIVDSREGDLLLSHLGDHIDEKLAVQERVDRFYDTYGIRIHYTDAGLGSRQSYAKKGEEYTHFEPKSQAEVVAALTYLESVLQDYGTDFIKGDVENIYLVNDFKMYSSDGTGKELGGLYVGNGNLIIHTLSSVEHELFHAAERATENGGALAGTDWFDQEGHDDEHGHHDHEELASVDGAYTKVPTQEELEMFYRAGATSFYSYAAGMEGNSNEVQAEVWEFLRTKEDSAEILSKKEGGGYAYPQLRENAIRVLMFAYQKSNAHMDREWWKASEKDFDDDLWSHVEEVERGAPEDIA